MAFPKFSMPKFGSSSKPPATPAPAAGKDAATPAAGKNGGYDNNTIEPPKKSSSFGGKAMGVVGGVGTAASAAVAVGTLTGVMPKPGQQPAAADPNAPGGVNDPYGPNGGLGGGPNGTGQGQGQQGKFEGKFGPQPDYNNLGTVNALESRNAAQTQQQNPMMPGTMPLPTAPTFPMATGGVPSPAMPHALPPSGLVF